MSWRHLDDLKGSEELQPIKNSADLGSAKAGRGSLGNSGSPRIQNTAKIECKLDLN